MLTTLKRMLIQNDTAELRDRVKRGRWAFYFGKVCEAKAAKQHSLAKRYENLAADGMEISDDALTGISALISSHELVQAAGLRISRHELTNTQGYTLYSDGMDSVCILIRRAKKLIEGFEKNKLLGFLLIAEFKPTLQLYGKRR